ncbi:RNA-directed DNA polymerase, eukaryota [Tanacetum coccineum]
MTGLCIPFRSRRIAMVKLLGFFLKLAFKFAGLAYLYAKVFSFGIFVGFEDGSSFHPSLGTCLGFHQNPSRKSELRVVKGEALVAKGEELVAKDPNGRILKYYKHVSVASKLRANSLISSFWRSPRSGIEEEQLLLLISNTSSVILPNISDRWSWLLDPSGDFSVKSTREFIDDSMLPKTDVPTRWVKSIPIKINIFAWRVSLDKLPTRLNLSLRGLDIPSIICPLCSIAVESTSHLLFSCQLARQLMIKVVHWWELEYQDFHSYEDWLLWFKNLRVSKRLKDVFEGVCYISWWVIWKFRNQVLFGINFPRLDLLFDDIVRLSFHWCSSRCSSNFDWNTWMKNPSSIILLGPSVYSCSTKDGPSSEHQVSSVSSNLQRPPSIDNSDFISRSAYENSPELEIYDTLVEGTDYILVPEKMWNLFYKWMLVVVLYERLDVINASTAKNTQLRY